MSDPFDFFNSDEKEKSRFDDVTVGDHAATIKKIDDNYVANTGNKGWIVTFDMDEYPGVPIWGRLMLMTGSRWIWRMFFEALGLPYPDPKSGITYRPQDLIGLRLVIRVVEGEKNFKTAERYYPLVEAPPADWSDWSEPDDEPEQLEAFPDD